MENKDTKNKMPAGNANARMYADVILPKSIAVPSALPVSGTSPAAMSTDMVSVINSPKPKTRSTAATLMINCQAKRSLFVKRVHKRPDAESTAETKKATSSMMFNTACTFTKS